MGAEQLREAGGRGPDSARTEESGQGTRWRTWLESNYVFVCVYAPDGRLIAANAAALAATGVLPGEVLGKHFTDIADVAHSPESVEPLHELFARAGRGETFRAEIPVRLRGGRRASVDCFVCPLRDASGQIVEIATAAVEIGGRDQVEPSLLRINRELRMLTECTQAVVRAQSEGSLLDAICRIIVETGGYRLAWVGFADDDSAHTVRAVARAGAGQGYLDNISISWADSELGRGPTGRAVRERRVQICRDMQSDPSMAPWRDEATLHGYRSSIALPLTSAEEMLGVLTIYSAQPDAFDAPELALLSELTQDLAYGIAALRARGESERAQHQAQRFRALLDRTDDMIYVCDAATGRIIDANDAVSRRLGYSRRELLRMNVTDFSLSAAAMAWEQWDERLRTGGPLVLEGRHRTKGGAVVDVEVNLQYVEQENRRFIVAVTRDVTERKRDRERIARLVRMLHMQASINAAVLRISDQNELLREACRVATAIGGYDRAVFSRVDPDGRAARPQFRAGGGVDFPEPDILPISDGAEADTSLSSRALRTGEVTVCDLRRSEPPVAMRAQLQALGYRSVVALPLLIGGRRFGVLTLTSKDENFVGDEELVLLQDMTASLSSALRSQEHAEAVQFLASFDALTGLSKRALFCERLERLLQAGGDPRHPPAVAVFDVLHLSHINDTFGRRVGDLVLREVAERLKAHSNSDDTIGYLGGGVFALVEAGLGASEGAISEILDRDIFAEPVSIEGRSLRLSYRSGAARFPVDGSDASTLLERAEAAHKHAKEAGEPYLHYQLKMHSDIAERLALEHRLRAAVDERQFALYYQPQIAFPSGRIESVEALLRWNDPEGGLTAPSRFLSVLESSGLIVAVGEWALGQVAEDCERWTKLGLPAFRVAVNVSGIQLRRKNFVPKVLEAAQRISACPGRGLDLEITESTLLQDLEGTSRKLRELRAAGIRVALDDFGTGYSALGLLSKLPVDLVKIDRTFVEGLPDDPSSSLLVESIIRLAIGLGLVTVAEGIESKAQYEALRAMNCSLWQGYLHGPPIPRSDLERRVIKPGRRVKRTAPSQG